MKELRVGDQVIRHDRDATVAVYESLEHGFAEECGCLFCRNFAGQRSQVYPESFRALLEQLGVDPNKEGEAFECGPVADGCHLYGGWFYFVGEMIQAGERNCNAADSRYFEFFLTTAHPRALAFRGGPVLAVEFMTHIEWMLTESADAGRRPACGPG